MLLPKTKNIETYFVNLLFNFQYLTLTFDMPWLPLVNDFKQGLFYASLMVFWLVFAGEHLLNDDGPGKFLQNVIKYIKK